MSLHLEMITPEFEEYLRDESRVEGKAEKIGFAHSEDEIRQFIQKAREAKVSVTMQGARTGITAGAVPEGGWILNLSRMDKATGMRYDERTYEFYLRVQPGMILENLRVCIERKEFETGDWSEESLQAYNLFREKGTYFFPPDPTETSAEIGGMVSCNASGARTFYYGSTRDFIQSLDVILADSSKITLKRGKEKAEDRSFKLQSDSGHVIESSLPAYTMPQIKSAAGYYSKPNMDMIDLFIGSEGTLGIISEIELRLIPFPKIVWGMMIFMPNELSALRLVECLRGERVAEVEVAVQQKPTAIEFFNHHALDFLRREKTQNPAFAELPDLPKEYHSAVYIEFQGETEDEVTESMLTASEIMVQLGGSDEATWLGSSEQEIQRLKDFRHAIPEAVNLTIDKRRKLNPSITKLGTDMAVPDDALEDMMQMYNTSLAEAGLESVMFGHIGNNHIHVNILPNSEEEYIRGKQLYLEWAKKIIGWCGTVAAEHGIGKLKKSFLLAMYGEKHIADMRKLKHVFDPENMLNPGNLF